MTDVFQSGHASGNIPKFLVSRRNFVIGIAGVVSGRLGSSLKAIALPSRSDTNPDWTDPQPPFRIAGNLHYVGSRDLASYLITTPQGHILINSNLASSPPQIRASVEKLGFKFSDVKILLISHAHFDHCAGSAEIVKQTGAKYMVMDADCPDVESGGKTNFQFANQPAMLYHPAKVQRILHDGEQVQLGSAMLTARKTAGHTKGCTTWTMQIHDELLQQAIAEKTGQAAGGARPYDVIIVGSPNVLASYNLLHSSKYPTMAADFDRQFHTLDSLRCDIFLGAHGGYFDMLSKYARLKSGDLTAFIDPEGYRRSVAEAKSSFNSELRKQQAKNRR